MIAAQAKHAVAGQQIQILLALHVPQIRPLGARVAAVEADGFQRADVGGIDVLGVQLVIFPGVLLDQRGDVQRRTRGGGLFQI